MFAIDEKTGEPKLIQTIEGHGIHLRTFGIDPSGKLLVATSIRPMPLRDGKTLTTGIMVYRIGGTTAGSNSCASTTSTPPKVSSSGAVRWSRWG